MTDGRTQTITMSLRCFAVGDKKGIRVEYGRTTFERIFNFKCVAFERILPVVCLGNLISKNVKNRNKNIYTLL
jgi:hypothetical protein